MNQNRFAPESLMMGYGYVPAWSEGAIKCPLFQTSTFEFSSAEEGKAFFELAYGKRAPHPHERQGMLYSRLNNPNLEILEDRLTLWDGAETAAVFSSGMSAITTVLLQYLQPGDVLLYSTPLYGGTHHFVNHVLPKFGIRVQAFNANETAASIQERLREQQLLDKLKLLFIETPANPTLQLIDIAEMATLAAQQSNNDKEVLVVVDNTFLGPLWQHPLAFGAHLVVYSATKYIGGHSDVIAGAVLGSKKYMEPIKALRTFLGNMMDAHTAWLLLRSLETMKIRMEAQQENAKEVAAFIQHHPAVENVYYLGIPENRDKHQQEIFERQCEGSGAMISFKIKGGEAEAFRFLNNLQLIKLAVSLGSTESLAEHPATMTHSDVPDVEKKELGITPNLIRLSVGVERAADLISDLDQALQAAVPRSKEIHT